jgi:acetyl esterase/lipase
MKPFLTILAFISALNGVLLFIRPKDTSLNLFLWFPKMMAAALSPVIAISGALYALIGFLKRDWRLQLAGILGAVTAARFISKIPDGYQQFKSMFEADDAGATPMRQKCVVTFKPNQIIGMKQNGEKPFLADLWYPQEDCPHSGIGIIYSHGSGWRVGDKDMLTRPFFRRLAEQGHLVLDIAYSLHPEVDVPIMVSEVNQAILWMKENSQVLQVDPTRIVLMGGSAGAHLSLLAAYTPHLPEFQLHPGRGDTSVCGVIAYYPPVDLGNTFAQTQRQHTTTFRPIDRLADNLFNLIFNLPSDRDSQDNDQSSGYHNYMIDILGCTPDEFPQVSNLLSPINHVSKDCPPTLLLQGSDDVFDLTPGTRRLHQALKQAGVPVVYVEYPHTEHGFDLILPQISPVAKAATREVVRFLDLMNVK